MTASLDLIKLTRTFPTSDTALEWLQVYLTPPSGSSFLFKMLAPNQLSKQKPSPLRTWMEI